MRRNSPKAGVCDGAGQPPIAGQSCHVQVFGHDRFIPCRQFGGDLVQGAGPHVRDAGIPPEQMPWDAIHSFSFMTGFYATPEY
jgi:hypothetical protein